MGGKPRCSKIRRLCFKITRKEIRKKEKKKQIQVGILGINARTVIISCKAPRRRQQQPVHQTPTWLAFIGARPSQGMTPQSFINFPLLNWLSPQSKTYSNFRSPFCRLNSPQILISGDGQNRRGKISLDVPRFLL